MAKDIGFDPVLGKLREIDAGGGTGGETYNFNTNEFNVSSDNDVSLKSVPASKVSGAVTGIEASVDGGTATISATGSTTSVKLTGTGGVDVKGNTNGEVELDAKDLSDGTQSVSKSLLETRYANIPGWSGEANTITILHFSDIHADTAALARILAATNNMNLDGKICTGDMVHQNAGEIASWWEPSVMTVIGNHECCYNYLIGDWDSLPIADRVSYYIAPFEASWGTISRPTGKTWYYKDFTKTACKVRLIALDLQCYFTEGNTDGTAQTTWLQGVLADAIINDRHVLIACHAPAPGASRVKCSFDQIINIDFSPTISWVPAEVVSAVASAISSGLNFCGYLCGHMHKDLVWDVLGDGTQYMFDITCAHVRDQIQWINSDLYRDSSLDAFNLVTIDPRNTELRIVRGGGANITNDGRKRQTICLNYATHELIDYERPRLEGDGRIEVNGITVKDKRYIDTVIVTGETMTMQAGRAFSADVAAAGTLTLNSEQVGTSAYGEVGLIDVHLGNAASVSVGPNIVLIDGFTSSARNICEVQFIDGLAIVKPLTVIADPLVVGYYVTLTTGTGSGSLYYGLADTTEDEIYFDASTDGTACDFGGVAVGTDKLITGNGITSTTVSGAVDCGVYGTTVTALNLSGSTITGGTMTILDAGAPGGTVQLEGFIEPRSVSGGVYDLSSHPTVASVDGACVYASGQEVNISGATFCNGQNALPACFSGGVVTMTDCLVTENSETSLGDCGVAIHGATATITGCTFSNNRLPKSYTCCGLHFAAGFTATVSRCHFVNNVTDNVLGTGAGLLANTSACGPFAIQDCYFSGGTVGFGAINCYGSGAQVEITGCTFTSMTNQTNSGGVATLQGGVKAVMSSCVFSGTTGGAGAIGVGVFGANTSVTMINCSVTKGRASYGAYGVKASASGTLFLSSCTVINNSSGTTDVRQDASVNTGGRLVLTGCTVGHVYVGGGTNGGHLEIAGTNDIGQVNGLATSGGGTVTISGGASITLTSSIAPVTNGGITVLDGSCTVNGHSIAAGTYTSISSDGTTA